jgi:uncharacterized membrane protein
VGELVVNLLFELAKHWGVIATVLVVVLMAPLVLVAFLLRWVVKQSEAFQRQALAREERLVEVIRGQHKALADHNQTTVEFRNEVKTANEHQRREHQEMVSAIKESAGVLRQLLIQGR